MPSPHAECGGNALSRQPGTSACCLAVLTRSMSPGHHLTSLPSLLQVRRPVRHQDHSRRTLPAWCSPAPPTLPWFSPRPSLQLCLETGSCFLQFQGGARVATGAGWPPSWPSHAHRVEGSVPHSQPGSVGTHSLDRCWKEVPTVRAPHPNLPSPSLHKRAHAE